MVFSFFKKMASSPPRSEPLSGFLLYSAPDFTEYFSGLSDDQAVAVAELYRALITPGITHPIAQALLDAPRDGYAISQNLKKHYAIAKTSGLSTYLCFIAVEIENMRRLAEMGIEKAHWRVSTCGLAPGLNPHHKQLEGKVYFVQKGLLVLGDVIRPSAEFGCTCHGASMIPGFRD
jgi:hypothetical protein